MCFLRTQESSQQQRLHKAILFSTIVCNNYIQKEFINVRRVDADADFQIKIVASFWEFWHENSGIFISFLCNT